MRLIVLLILSMMVTSCATQSSSNSGGRDSGQVEKNIEAAAINIHIGTNYISSGEYQLANDKLQKAFKQDPNSSKARWTYAVLQEKLNQPKAAEHYYNEAIKINQNDSIAHQNYASFLCRNGRYQEANTHFKIALSDPLFKNREATSLTAGVCAMEIPDYKVAGNYLTETLRLNSKNRVALYQMAKSQFLQNDFAAAQSYLRDFEEVSQHTSQSLWLAYRTERGLGNTRIAQSYAQLLSKQFPTSKEAEQLARVN